MFAKYFQKLRASLLRWRHNWQVQSFVLTVLVALFATLLIFYLTPRLQPSAIFIIALLLAFIIPIPALYIIRRQVQEPLQDLAERVQNMTQGNFLAITPPIEGASQIETIRKNIFHLASYIQAYQQGMRGYLDVLIARQEKERAELAEKWQRELLESLPLLRQRLDMTQQAVVNKSSSSVAHLAAARALATNIAQNVYNITTELYPAKLPKQGLTVALETLVARFEQQGSLSTQFEVRGTPFRLSQRQEVGIYRIAQEALHNIERHAHATEVSLHLNFEESEEATVTLTIVDDGVGFKPPQTSQELLAHPYAGLMNMQEQALLIGGQLTIHTRLNKGTRINLQVSKSD